MNRLQAVVMVGLVLAVTCAVGGDGADLGLDLPRSGAADVADPGA